MTGGAPSGRLCDLKRINAFQGWTNNSVIDRLYKRNTGPAAVADMNKFYDDRAAPGK